MNVDSVTMNGKGRHAVLDKLDKPDAPAADAGIWSYSLFSGWSRIPAPADDGAYEEVTTYGASWDGLSFTILDHEVKDDWFLSIGTPGVSYAIYIPDLPSLLALLGQLTPMLAQGRVLEDVARAEEKKREENRKKYAGRKAVTA